MTAHLVTPVDRYLEEQQRLSAVQRFSRHHKASSPEPAQARYYRDLIPLSRPGANEQYGFEVDLDRCSGCKSCVTACSSLNGLDPGESWRSAGTLHGVHEPYRQTVTTACHHCLEPGCLQGCPVNAYEKDPDTGVVAHLDDQCIGCGYCTFTCPYEVPRLNESRGIVRKCDMCQGRLAAGEAPACVQACPTQAIRIAVVDRTDARDRARSGTFLAGAPDPAITVPTTRYVSTRAMPTDVRAGDFLSVRPAHAHPALAVMLVLTQIAVGTALVGIGLRIAARGSLIMGTLRHDAVAVFVTGVVALLASLFHLGRPQYAFRAVLGMRHSWLSREIAAFGGFAALAALGLAVEYLPSPGASGAAVRAGVTVAGLAGVGCSVMIYGVTGRAWWRVRTTSWKFALTTLIGGIGVLWALSLVTGWLTGDAAARQALADIGRPGALLLVATTTGKLAGESAVFRHLRDPDLTDLRRTALLLRRDLRRSTTLRFGLALGGGVAAPLLVLLLAADPAPATGFAAGVAVLGLLAVVTGELIERWQFFAAVAAPRMPGDHP